MIPNPVKVIEVIKEMAIHKHPKDKEAKKEKALSPPPTNMPRWRQRDHNLSEQESKTAKSGGPDSSVAQQEAIKQAQKTLKMNYTAKYLQQIKSNLVQEHLRRTRSPSLLISAKTVEYETSYDLLIIND
jgi:mannose-6-phosphate isomerase class I